MSFVTSMLVVPVVGMAVSDEVLRLQIIQIFTSLLTFMVPPLVVVAYQKANREVPFVRFFEPPFTWASLGQALLIVLFAQPICIFFTWVMSLLPSPDVLDAISAEISESTSLLLTPRSVGNIVLTLLSICVAAPIAEEFFFRGALQGWLLSRTKSVHLSVWLIALIFGTIHLEWSGMIPRIVLGAILGYCAVYSGIPTAICVHALNNLIAYLSFVVMGKGMDEVTFSTFEIIAYGLSALVCAWFIIRIFYNQKSKSIP